MTNAAIITAAGRGSRAGGDRPKQWQALAGKPVLQHTLDVFRASARFSTLVVTIHPDDRADAVQLGPDVILVEGGATRAESVKNALEHLESMQISRVFIHDGARPLVTPALLDQLHAALDQSAAAAPALMVTDALWRGERGRVSGVQDRAGLYRAQTPQAFHFAPILAAHRAHPGHAADDVEVARAAGIEVAIVAGEADNIKITLPQDFDQAAQILTMRAQRDKAMDIRLGNGFDVHAFCAGDHVWLCGVKIPHSQGLLGHSDADVGMHALTDALYGALALGDIGQHFPPSDPQWKGAESHIFLAHAMEQARAQGFTLGNADVTLICERPKIGPHAPAMRAALAQIMGVDMGRVSVKATTSEKLGFTGREEGIAALATATLVKT
ncbi:bifunctional 2-C-methyl-D-erythritol 4-phosphate cytidylyltransferase/2-C-methyl-D-erythritol 2,4-cyclodiphosphate synthase [Pseudorhodobacter sp. E13]|uniref:bifunctional 2-C-methyl-D-erythritol 4-phosphate cytidylyltransferase/2-C-methyl-D-erythritol 2,4-cyclodiphosphate synthase n=1 Tax=Pseudorhodobacter sp. E13 TaxID=2487931 RepID=UPI000F8D5603|nr:bifunctional 2-C-methyl-D-erythritol 4-phosphate cytidylyltransferase/2-C-methyl-D-erythritol 2,4-cyclodiphosphate synthase [Pseudorhodobacter sp. E13]RUS60382.1 bifunctional 2-C-methyl-D-erythritol 4-phosphate cytidylyltransferase/2-C-methyl-D-erythritol 2,4-cyclodiphosphate synthase [Pseudorhodobacter sp. E13]